MASGFQQLSPTYREEFSKELSHLNHIRSRNLSLVLYLLTLLFIFSDYINYTQGLWNWDTCSSYSVLFYLHIILGVFLSFFLLTSWLLFKSSDKCFNQWHARLNILFSSFIVLFSACISINDQRLHNQIVVYIIASIIIAINNYLKPYTSAAIYIISWAVFMVGLTLSQSDEAILKGNYINGTLVTVCAWFLSANFYNMKLRDFISQKTIEQKNQEAESHNKELLKINNRLAASLQALDDSQNVLFTLASALESKDTYTRGHSERVAQAALQLARVLGLSEHDQNTIWQAAQLHDIGKIGIPDAILNKAGKLSDKEWEIMRSHPVTGETICSPLSFAKEILPIIRHHHERYDGTGYPDGLKGEAIPYLARIIMIPDTVDAITSQRSYRPSRTLEFAFEELIKGKGTQFDPVIVDAYISNYNKSKLSS